MPEVAVRTLPFKPRNLNRPQYRPRLIGDLAAREPYEKLAERYDVAVSSISDFAKRHRAEIETQAADLENQFAGLWIADKRARLAAYQEDVERCDREIRAGRRLGITPQELAPAYAAKHRALDAAAKELGAYRQVIDVNVTTVKYEIVGVEVGELR